MADGAADAGDVGARVLGQLERADERLQLTDRPVVEELAHGGAAARRELGLDGAPSNVAAEGQAVQDVAERRVGQDRLAHVPRTRRLRDGLGGWRLHQHKLESRY